METALKDVRALYGSYESIIEEVGSETIENRFNKIFSSMKEFIEDKKLEEDVFINTRILLIAILDCFTDLHRLKSFHQISEVNAFKEKAYESAWILRRKPIQVKSKVIESDYINEKFIYSYLMFYLLDGRTTISDANFLSENNQNKYNLAIKGFLNTLLYYLKFRDCSPQVLELMLMAFKAGEVTKDIEIEKKIQLENNKFDSDKKIKKKK